MAVLKQGKDFILNLNGILFYVKSHLARKVNKPFKE